MPTTDELQTQIDAMKAFIGNDGYRAGQQRIRDNYTASLQNIVADATLILSDKAVDAELRETQVADKLEAAMLLKRRIDKLDQELGDPEGNRASRRRQKGKQAQTKG